MNRAVVVNRQALVPATAPSSRYTAAGEVTMRLGIMLLPVALASACSPRDGEGAPADPPVTDTDTSVTDTLDTPPDTDLPEDTGWVGTPPLQLRKIDTAVYPEAVCPAGSPAAYYVGFGKGDGADKWSIHLDWAQSCMTVASCLSAPANDISSDGLPEEQAFDGIFSRDEAINPGTWNWNHVFVFGCPRDRGVGNAGASPATEGLNFRGYAIVRDVLRELEDDGLGEASTVLLHGSSGGGRAVFNSIAFVQERYPAARVVGVADAAWDVHPDIFGPSATADQIALVSTLWEAIDGQRDPTACEAARLLAGEPLDWCFIDYYYAPSVAYPILFRRALFDDDTVREYSERNPKVPNEEVKTLISNALIASFGDGRIPAGSGGFAPLSDAHLGLLNKNFSEESIGGDTLSTLLRDWLAGVERDYLLIADLP